MHGTGDLAYVLALSKHQEGGIAGLVVGVIVLAFGAIRVAAKVAGAAVIAVVGVVILVVGILLFTHAI